METRVGLYVRISTSQQDHALQLDDLRRVAEQRGWTTTEYIDTGSGKSGAKLPERDRLMEDARSGKLDVLAVWKLDRLGRSLPDLLDILRNLETWGVQFVSLRDGMDSTGPAGRLFFSILGAIAEFERDLIRQRVKAGLEAAKRRGVLVGRPRSVLPVAKARELIANGMSLRACAKRLGVDPHTLRRSLRRNPAPEATAETRMDAGPDQPETTGGES